jgi:hypothetical protein
MDAFERVIATILEQDGYWVRSSFKVDLTKEEKRRIGKPTIPRPEIDLVAYRGQTNALFAVECKSYLDSTGVSMAAFDGSSATLANRFKLFCDDNWRAIVEARLIQQMESTGMSGRRPRVTWVLAAGKIASDQDREHLERHFLAKGWQLWDVEWIVSRLEGIADRGYENDVVSMVAKLLERRRREAKQRRGVAGASSAGAPVSSADATYRYSRLCFKADVIEPLRDNQSFRIVTPGGTFQMTKAEFHRDFSGVVKTMSYRERRVYHYPQVPHAAEVYRVGGRP